MKTSVIIPCWILDDFQLKLTHRCIDSVRETSDVELIVIDNGSEIGQEYLKEESDIYINFPKNLGYVRAINDGWKYSTGKYLVAGNNDYYMSPGWDEALRTTLDTIPECGIACPSVEGGPTSDHVWEEPGTPGGWWMITKDLQKQLGFMDEAFFNVFADYDYLWRMKKLTGKKVMSTPKVTVQHYGEGTLGKFSRRQEEYMMGQWILMNKWKDDPLFPDLIGRVMDPDEVMKWLEDNLEYSKGIDFSS